MDPVRKNVRTLVPVEVTGRWTRPCVPGVSLPGTRAKSRDDISRALSHEKPVSRGVKIKHSPGRLIYRSGRTS